MESAPTAHTCGKMGGDGEESQLLLYNHNVIYAFRHDALFRFQINRLVLILTNLLRIAALHGLQMNRFRVFGQPEIMKNVMSYLDARSLVAASAVCRFWSQIYIENEEQLWTDLCISDFNVRPSAILSVTPRIKKKGKDTRGNGREKLSAKKLYQCTFDRMTAITRPKLAGVQGLSVTTVDRCLLFRL